MEQKLDNKLLWNQHLQMKEEIERLREMLVNEQEEKKKALEKYYNQDSEDDESDDERSTTR